MEDDRESQITFRITRAGVPVEVAIETEASSSGVTRVRGSRGGSRESSPFSRLTQHKTSGKIRFLSVNSEQPPFELKPYETKILFFDSELEKTALK